MVIISAIMSTFFINYFLCWIWNLMGKGTYKNKFILITIVDILMLADDIYLYVPYIITNNSQKLSNIIYLSLSVLGTIIGYFITLKIINDGSRIFNFKSKREKEFSKLQKVENRDVMLKSSMNKKIFISGFIILGLLGIYFNYTNNLVYAFISYTISVLCLVISVIIIFTKTKEYILVLIIKTESEFIVYDKKLSINDDYKKYYKGLSDIYIIKPYAKIKYDNEIHLVFGLETNEINKEYLNDIDMEKNNLSYYKTLFKELNQRELYYIEVDKDLNVLKKECIESLKV